MAMPWRFIATRLGWRARFVMVGAHPRLMICHTRHGVRFSEADGWKRAVCVSLRHWRQRTVRRFMFGSLRQRNQPRRSGTPFSEMPDADAEPT